MREPNKGGTRGVSQAAKASPTAGGAHRQISTEAPIDFESLTPESVLRLQRTIGNQAVARLLGGQSLPPSSSDAAAPDSPSAGTARTFPGGRTAYLKGSQPLDDVQRKIGNRGKKNDAVWFDPQQSGVDENPRGRITNVFYAKGMLGVTPRVASLKHKNLVKKVNNYLVTMDADNKWTKEEERVAPPDRQWFLTSPADRSRAEEDEAEGEEKEREGPIEPDMGATLLAGAGLKAKAKQALATGKGAAAVGKDVAAFGKGVLGKVDYVKTDVDTALDVAAKATGVLNKAATAFPPLKAFTEPAKSAISGVKTIRTLYLAHQLVRAGDAVPLTLSRLGEAQEALEELDVPSLSDDEAQSAVMKAAEALGALRTWLERQMYDEGGEDEGEE